MNKKGKLELTQIDSLLSLETRDALPKFDSMLVSSGLSPLHADRIDILQINVGRVCNQTCRHCHVNAGPARTEIMSREVFESCLTVLDKMHIPTVDLTGGSPELNPHFRWFISEVKERNLHVIDRCNLTILFESDQADLIEFLGCHKVEIFASLPALTKDQTDSQRGSNVFAKSITALQMLNEIGYGVKDSSLILNLVTNPVGAFLPGTQKSLEAHWKRVLKSRYDIIFNNLYTITNMPIGRFLGWLKSRKQLMPYMRQLVDAYNPDAANTVMCKSTLSVDWQGYMYDCDFNQMLGLKVDHGLPEHINNFAPETFKIRRIVTSMHCFGCTAGGGSSCGGALID